MPVSSEKQKHIQEFVQNQRNKFKSQSRGGFRVRTRDRYSSIGHKIYARSLGFARPSYPGSFQASRDYHISRQFDKRPSPPLSRQQPIGLKRSSDFNDSIDRRKRFHSNPNSTADCFKVDKNSFNNNLVDLTESKCNGDHKSVSNDIHSRRRNSPSPDRSTRSNSIKSSPIRRSSPVRRSNSTRRSSPFRRTFRELSPIRRSGSIQRSSSNRRRSPSKSRRNFRSRSRSRGRSNERRERSRRERSENRLRERSSSRSRIRNRSSSRTIVRDNRSNRSLSRERARRTDKCRYDRSRKIDSNRDDSIDRFVDNIIDDKIDKDLNRKNESPSKRNRSITRNIIFEKIKNYLTKSNSNSTLDSTFKSLTATSTRNSKNVISYNDVKSKKVLFDIRARQINMQSKSFDVKAIPNTLAPFDVRSQSDSSHKTETKNIQDCCSENIKDDHSNKQNMINSTTNSESTVLDDDWMDLSDENIERKNTMKTEETKAKIRNKYQLSINDPRLKSKSYQQHTSRIIENASDSEDQVNDLLKDKRFVKIRDYSPDMYKKKRTQTENEDEMKYSSYHADDYKQESQINANTSNGPPPLIAHHSLRSFKRNEESRLSDRDLSNDSFAYDFEKSSHIFGFDDKEVNEHMIKKNASPNLDNVSVEPIIIEICEQKPKFKLTRQFLLKCISIPKALNQLLPTGYKVAGSNHETEQIQIDANEVKVNSLESSNKNQINYKLKLKELIKEHNLPKPIYENSIFIENDCEIGGYVCKLKIGDRKWVTAMNSHRTPDDAENSVCKKALEEFKQKLKEQENSNESSDIVSKIIKVLNFKKLKLIKNFIKFFISSNFQS